MSTLHNLHDVYVHNLKDLYSANKQSADVTTQLVGAATNSELKSALEAGVKGIHKGNETLEKLLAARDEKPSGAHCKGMEGLVKEAKAHAINAQFEDKDAQDAMIIAQYQRMVHYAIAGYGTGQAWANRLGYTECSDHLQTMLDDTYSGDKHMTEIATGKGGINAAATA